MYQVVLKEVNGRYYYYQYFQEEGLKGTAECEELPPYQDIKKARCCYLEDGEWVFDEEKYEFLSEEQKEAFNNDEIVDGLLDLADTVDNLITSVNTIAENIDVIAVLEQLTNKISQIKGGTENG